MSVARHFSQFGDAWPLAYPLSWGLARSLGLSARSPVIDLRFAGAEGLHEDVTFTRSTKAWDYDSTGTLEENASGDPRFDYDPATLKALGLLAEKQRTNSLLDNRDLSTANWTVDTNLSVTQNQTGLDGVANKAWTVTKDSAGSFSTVTQDVTVPDDSNPAAAVWFVEKQDSASVGPEFIVVFSGGTTAINYAVGFDPSTGDTGDIDGSGTVNVYDRGDYWEVELVKSNNGTGNTTFSYRCDPCRVKTSDLTSTNDTVTGSIVYDFGGVRLNASTFGSPIETGSSAVTVNADDANMSLPSELASGFVWVIHARAPSISGVLDWLGSIDKGTLDSRMTVFRDDGTNVMRLQVRGVASATSVIAVDNDTDLKVAVRVESGRYAISVNGETPVTDSSTGFNSGATTKRIGMNHDTTEFWNSTIALDRMYSNPGDWSDADLQEASS